MPSPPAGGVAARATSRADADSAPAFHERRDQRFRRRSRNLAAPAQRLKEMPRGRSAATEIDVAPARGEREPLSARGSGDRGCRQSAGGWGCRRPRGDHGRIRPAITNWDSGDIPRHTHGGRF